MFARNYNAPSLYFYPIRAADFILAKASGSLFVVRPRGLYPRISASVRFVKLKYFLNFSIFVKNYDEQAMNFLFFLFFFFRIEPMIFNPICVIFCFSVGFFNLWIIALQLIFIRNRLLYRKFLDFIRSITSTRIGLIVLLFLANNGRIIFFRLKNIRFYVIIRKKLFDLL